MRTSMTRPQRRAYSCYFSRSVRYPRRLRTTDKSVSYVDLTPQSVTLMTCLTALTFLQINACNQPNA